MKKHIIRWLCLVLLIAAVVGVTAVHAAETAVDGLVLENMVILYPADATE